MSRTAESVARGCIGKVQYESLELASDVARRCVKKRGKPLRVYHCEMCQRWHMTSVPRVRPVMCALCLREFTPRTREQWTCDECPPKDAT